MFDEFNKTYENGFRVFFLIWVCFWGVVNIFSLLFSYLSFDGVSDSETSAWLVNVVGQSITITLGVFLLFIMSAIPNKIAKLKKIKNLPILASFVAGYYLIANIINIGVQLINADLRPERTLVFEIAWLIPSIILLILHMLYVANLNAYNESLTENKTPAQA